MGAFGSSAAQADCKNLPTHSDLQAALRKSVAPTGGPENGGFELHMWASIVDRDGTVCAVAFSGNSPGDQWPGSRVISAQKANTANAFSLGGFALSTANLYSATQPGGSLFGLQESNPVDPDVAYAGSSANFGTQRDPMVGKRIGGVNVFGGGLGLYRGTGVVGGLGVSGDSSCADHNVAWRVREALRLAAVPAGPSPNNDDGIVYDIGLPDPFVHADTRRGRGRPHFPLPTHPASASGWGHPVCAGDEVEVAVSIGAGVGPED
ncbi:heme-binding protein [Indioceanicola profundi]|uniref:heme-binding protein n=1 Tax=Indioceanicola profundi TaxID=2220096 RepID=UPI000E6AA533|nr:heme-binding protein [Indioceanicola profundi]